jgi:hypothetical protein
MTRGKRIEAAPAALGSTRRRSLAELVQDYLCSKDPCHDAELAWCRNMPSLAEAVRKAALCETPDGKRQSHQRRIPRAALEEAAERLSGLPLDRAKDFEDLLARITKSCRTIPSFGPLTQYDVAFRIGLYLNKLPERVHLHAGTRAGAKALGLPHEVPHLEMEDLPIELRALQPWQVEDFLCIYKDELGGRLSAAG